MHTDNIYARETHGEGVEPCLTTAVQMVPVVVLPRLKYPLGNPLLRANTENMFAFDMWQNPIWDLEVNPRGIIYSSCLLSSLVLFSDNPHSHGSP